MVCLAPDCFRLRLYPAFCAHDCHRSVENPKRPLDLDREIHMSRGIDDVNPVVLPKAGCRCGGDCYSALLFLLHPVHRCGAFMDLSDFVCASRIKQDAFRRRGLSGIDMSHDPDISYFFKRILPRHFFSPILLLLLFTSDNAQKLCWIRPSYAYLHVF